MTLSLAEAITNAAIGLLISWLITYAMLPLWDLHPTAGQSAAITGVYFAISAARSFVIRETFRRLAG